jgi:hypothetical protein
MITSTDSPRISPFRRHRLFVFVLVALLIVSLVAVRLVVEHRGSSASGVATTTAAVGRIAPTGSFTTTSDHSANLASYIGGHTTMVWFIAGGCASCAVSIPAVAQHLHQLTGDGVQVVTLGLYGAFPTGRQGVVQLASFGSAAAGTSITRPGWTWGMASKALSLAYDPSGTPDEYFLVASDGHVVYQNSVPVSTMPQLLSKVSTLG